MRWFYDVKKRKTIIWGLVFSLLAIIIIVGANFNNKGNELQEGLGIVIKETATPLATVASQSPKITTSQTIVPAAVPAAVPTTVPTVTPTVTVIPTVTATPTASTTLPTTTLTATPKKLSPTPIATLKVTPKKTVVTKTKAPIKTLAKPIALPTQAKTEVELRYKNGKTNSSTDSIYPIFMLINSGKQNVKLSDIKIRYYYTKDDSKSETFWCDYFTKGSTNVTGHVVALSSENKKVDSYLELRFSESAGEIKVGEKVEMSVGFAKNDWSEYNQKNDYSYSASRSFFAWNRVTLYISGKLVFGIEP